jgi:GNAT superfamily N-acetyltransferase
MRPEWPRAPTPEITYREVAEGDMPFLRALYRETREAELALTAWDDDGKRRFADEQFTLQDRWYRGHYPGAHLLAIERAGILIGRLYLHAGSEELRLMDLTLAAAERNRGLGSAIVVSLMEFAAARGLALTLHVETFNPAQRLYARLGFRAGEPNGIYLPMRWEPPRRG